MDLVHDERLDELRLRNWRLAFDDWFVSEHRRPFRDRVDLARESQLIENRAELGRRHDQAATTSGDVTSTVTSPFLTRTRN